MNTNSKLKALELIYDINKDKFLPGPNWEKMTDEELIKFSDERRKEFHKEHAVTDYARAFHLYATWKDKGLISKEEYDIFIKDERIFWDELQSKTK